MLWKLADNVKYEDDCEVGVRKAGKEGTLKKKSLSFCYNTEQKLDVGQRESWASFAHL